MAIHRGLAFMIIEVIAHVKWNKFLFTLLFFCGLYPRLNMAVIRSITGAVNAVFYGVSLFG